MKIVTWIWDAFRQKRVKGLPFALAYYLPKVDLRRVLLRVPDKRELLSEAAQVLSVSEHELLFLVGQKLSLPVLAHIPNLSIILSESERTLFFQAGAVPIVQNGSVVAIACVDPELCDGVLTEYSSLPKWIATWSGIRSALEGSRSIVSTFPERASDKNILGQKVIIAIIKESLKFQSEQVAIQRGTSMRYEILTSKNEIAKGSISDRAQESLESFLMQQISQGVLSLSYDVYAFDIRISYNSGSERYLLDWSKERIQSAPQDVERKIISFPGCEVKKEKHRENNTERGYRILVVEDNETFVKVLDRFLKKHRIEATFAKDGAEALRVLEKDLGDIEVVICDVHMPRMNGFEFVRSIRANPEYRTLPCIMLTSDTDVETQVSLLQEGIDLFIGKQEDPRILCLHIQRLLSRNDSKAA